MKKIISILAVISLILSTNSIAKSINIMTVTLVNHFSQPIVFNVGKNPEITPDFPANFTLNKDNKISSSVVPGPEGKDEVYINGNDIINGIVFFGISANTIYGYIGKGIAYSWKNEQDVTITFCTPKAFKKLGYCP